MSQLWRVCPTRDEETTWRALFRCGDVRSRPRIGDFPDTGGIARNWEAALHENSSRVGASRCGQGGVRRGAAGHRIDFTAQVLVLDRENARGRHVHLGQALREGLRLLERR